MRQAAAAGVTAELIGCLVGGLADELTEAAILGDEAKIEEGDQDIVLALFDYDSAEGRLDSSAAAKRRGSPLTLLKATISSRSRPRPRLDPCCK
jgi:hypothetical protein